jgi:hypothetical protein
MRLRQGSAEAGAPTPAPAVWTQNPSHEEPSPAPVSHTAVQPKRAGGLVLIEEHEPDHSRAAAALVSVLLWEPKGVRG